MVEAGLKEANSWAVHFDKKIDLRIDTFSTKFDAKFAEVNARFNQGDAKFDAMFN
jgi:hypothetical protein